MPGIVHGYPNLLLRAEALAVFIAAVGAYVLLGGSWIMFLVLMLVPDLFMLGYLFGPRAGAAVYNVGHWYVWPLAFIGVGATLAFPTLLQIGLIWVAHIAFDRVIKAGFKYGEGFRYSHLGVVTAKSAA
jgi:hypothetical protein